MSTRDLKPEKPNPFYQPVVNLLGRRQFVGLMAASFGWALLPSSFAQEAKPKAGRGGKGGKGANGGEDQTKARGPVFQGDYVLPECLAEFAALSVVLGRATDTSITASALTREAQEGFFELGTAPGIYTRKTSLGTFAAGEPSEVVFTGLKPDTTYYSA